VLANLQFFGDFKSTFRHILNA